MFESIKCANTPKLQNFKTRTGQHANLPTPHMATAFSACKTYSFLRFESAISIREALPSTPSHLHSFPSLSSLTFLLLQFFPNSEKITQARMTNTTENGNTDPCSAPAAQSEASERKFIGILGKRSRRDEEIEPKNRPRTRGGPRKARRRLWKTTVEPAAEEDGNGNEDQACERPKNPINRSGPRKAKRRIWKTAVKSLLENGSNRTENPAATVIKSPINRGGPRKAKRRVWKTPVKSFAEDGENGSGKQADTAIKNPINRGGPRKAKQRVWKTAITSVSEAVGSKSQPLT